MYVYIYIYMYIYIYVYIYIYIYIVFESITDSSWGWGQLLSSSSVKEIYPTIRVYVPVFFPVDTYIHSHTHIL